MASIFISYRRKDSSEATERIYKELREAFGEEELFFDSETLKAGDNWQQQIRKHVQHSNVMLIVIGEQWWKLFGEYRNAPDGDWVLFEIEEALRKSIFKRPKLVIPILVNEAEMPSKHELESLNLPQSVKQIRDSTHYMRIRSSPLRDFESDILVLKSRIEKELARYKRFSRKLAVTEQGLNRPSTSAIDKLRSCILIVMLTIVICGVISVIALRSMTDSIGGWFSSNQSPADLLATPQSNPVMGFVGSAPSATQFIPEPTEESPEENATSVPTTTPSPTMPTTLGMQVGQTIIINTTNGDPMRVRTSPGGSVLTRVQDGSRGTIIGGPIDASGYRWWQVSMLGNVTGWVAEEADGIRTILTATPRPEERRLAVGATVSLRVRSGASVNLRQGPGRSAQVIRSIEQTMVVVLIEGPIQVEDFRWWKVRLNDGQEGWVVEQIDSAAILVP
jgi:hypothetical protein